MQRCCAPLPTLSLQHHLTGVEPPGRVSREAPETTSLGAEPPAGSSKKAGDAHAGVDNPLPSRPVECEGDSAKGSGSSSARTQEVGRVSGAVTARFTPLRVGRLLTLRVRHGAAPLTQENPVHPDTGIFTQAAEHAPFGAWTPPRQHVHSRRP